MKEAVVCGLSFILQVAALAGLVLYLGWRVVTLGLVVWGLRKGTYWWLRRGFRQRTMSLWERDDADDEEEKTPV